MTPVAFLIFNRPELTQRVFGAIREARPAKLLIVADGPRPGRLGELEKCRAAREIAQNVNWPCEVLTNFSEVNLGCRKRVSSGLDWVFDQVEEAIILEDDCLPEPTFFPYCEELLERYRDDERVAHICGNHFRFTGERNPYSYYFSRYSFIWGWASWRRAWRNYDVDMKLWPEVRRGEWLESFLGERVLAAKFTQAFDSIYKGEIDTWDYQWGFACWINNGLSIRPNVNLISNIGFSAEATHTTDGHSATANLPTQPMAFPLQHPPFLMRNGYEDQFRHEDLGRRPLWLRAGGKLKSALHGLPKTSVTAKPLCS